MNANVDSSASGGGFQNSFKDTHRGRRRRSSRILLLWRQTGGLKTGPNVFNVLNLARYSRLLECQEINEISLKKNCNFFLSVHLAVSWISRFYAPMC